MVTLIKYGALGGGEKYNVNQMWIDGLSTDAKPTTTIDGMGIPNGSVYTEVDTGKTYMFDKDNAVWYEVSLGGGGGGGFTPTTAQLAAMNSGITAEKLQTDENNISTLQGVYKNKQTHTGSANFTNTSGIDDIKLTFAMTTTQYEQLKIAVADNNSLANVEYYTINPSDTLYVKSRYPATYVRVLQVDGSSTTGVSLTAEFFMATDKTFNARNNWTSGARSVQLFNGKVVNNNIGNDSVFIGYGSGGNSSGVKNTTVGVENLNDTTGQRNTSIGYHSLFRCTSGTDNAAVGAESGDDTTTGNQNTALGAYSLQRNAVGNNNTAVGFQALRGGQNVVTSSAEFNGNTIVGMGSMKNMTAGDYNTAIGYQTLTSSSNRSGCIAVGANVDCTKDNQMILGSSSITEVVFCGNKKINFNNDGTVTWEQIT